MKQFAISAVAGLLTFACGLLSGVILLAEDSDSAAIMWEVER